MHLSFTTPTRLSLPRQFLSAVLACLLCSSALAQTITGTPGVAVQTAVVDMSELSRLEAAQGVAPRQKEVHSPMPLPVGERTIVADPPRKESKLNALAVTTQSPPLSTNFLGILDNGQSIPPDTYGAVGPNHLMVTLNTQIKIQDRNGRQLSLVTLDSFWRTLGLPDTFDPKILYDPFDQRWIFTVCADGQSASSALLIAVSRTSDPTGQWNLFRVNGDPTGEVWIDYPSMGFNKNWIVVNVNMFNVADNFYNRAHFYVFNKADLYSGGVGQFTLLSDPGAFTASPAITYDNTLDTMYLLQDPFQPGSGAVRLFTITGPIGSEALSRVGDITIPQPWDIGPPASLDFSPQLGSSRRIQANDSRMHNVVYRNGSLWGTHTVFLPANNPNRASVQWWEINPLSRSVIQRGRIDDPSGQKFYTFPSIAVNRNNDVMLGFSRFGLDQYASANYAFRKSTDPLNTFQTEAVYKAGEAPYYKTFSGVRNRWGDYSMTAVDPVDDLSLWTIQEYASSPFGGQDRWGTWWGRLDLSIPPDGILEVIVSPVTGTEFKTGAVVPVFVSVSDVFPITNAVVVGSIPGVTNNMVFLNDGSAPDALASDNVYSANLLVPNTPMTLPLTIDITAPGASNATVAVVYFSFQVPSNDDFVNASKVDPPGAFQSSIIKAHNKLATLEPGEPNHAGVPTAGSSVWWNWTPAVSGPAIVDTTASGFDTVIGIYTGASVTNLTPIASVNDVGALKQGYVTFNTIAGTTYRIAVAGANTNQTGNIRLRIEPNGTPDTTPPVVTVSSPRSGTEFTTNRITVTGTAFDPSPNSTGIREVQISNQPKQAPAQVQVTNDVWSYTLTLIPLTNNTIQVTAIDFAGNASRPVVIQVRHVLPTATNDLLANATVLSGTEGTVFGNNQAATAELREPNHAGNQPSKTIWWAWQAPASGILFLSTAGSDDLNTTTPNDLDTLLAVYTGNRVTNLVEVASNDDAPGAEFSELTVGVQAGVTYRIVVDGYANSSGNIQLKYLFGAASVFPLSVDVMTSGARTNLGGNVLPFAGKFPATNYYPTNATVTLQAVTNRYYEFKRWEFGGGRQSLLNPLALVLSSPTNIVAVFEPYFFTENFQSGIRWQNANWTTGEKVIRTNVTVVSGSTTNTQQTNKVVSGDFVAQSANRRVNNSVASLRYRDTFRAGPGSFEYSVRSEPTWDKFEFFIDGILQDPFPKSGEVDWAVHSFTLTAGEHELEWRYTKDSSDPPTNNTDPNFDRAYVDNIDLPLASTPARISISRDASGGPQITLAGRANELYTIQISDDLRSWSDYAVIRADSSGRILFNDFAATEGGARFYRAVVK